LIPSIIAGGICISCKKEISCEGCKENNKLPTAIAGPDQVITLPTDSISLDGSASNDPDGMISEWLWSKIAGPASLNYSPLPIPNRVKPLMADGTAPQCGRVGSCHILLKSLSEMRGFLLNIEQGTKNVECRIGRRSSFIIRYSLFDILSGRSHIY
jgi:K319L-like, PKD domain